MQLSVTITSLGSAISIQDPHPTNGIFSKTIPAGGAKTFDCPWEVWHRISGIVEAHRAAGRCTVTIKEVTPTGTDGTNGANTTYNRADWALLNSFRSDISDLQLTVGALTGPFAYQGSIAINTSFPLLAAVQTGWVYTLTADTTDNAGVTYTNTGLAFLSGDEIVWDGSTWIKLGGTLTNPLQYKGAITVAADFPAPTGTAGVKSGFVYLIAAAVIDNDATKTNTGGIYTAGDSIQWNGTGWNILAPQNAMHLRGPIDAAADFPTAALVKTGHVYLVRAACTDNDGTKTNTGLMFQAEDIIVWYVNTWKILGRTALANVSAKCTGLDIKTDEIEVSAPLNGAAAKTFVPTHLLLKVVTNVGALNANGTINIGTAAGGTQIASGIALTGLTAVGATRLVPLAANTSSVAGNATLYANVEAADTGAGTLALDVYILGQQV